jgi:hypothetical protein
MSSYLKGRARQSDLRRVSRQVTIVFALLVALGILIAAMAWSTTARSAPLAAPADVVRVDAGG